MSDERAELVAINVRPVATCRVGGCRWSSGLTTRVWSPCTCRRVTDPETAARHADRWQQFALYLVIACVLITPGIVFKGALAFHEILIVITVEWLAVVLPLLRGMWWQGYARGLANRDQAAEQPRELEVVQR